MAAFESGRETDITLVAELNEKVRKDKVVLPLFSVRVGFPHTVRGGPVYVLVAITLEPGGFLMS